MTRLNLALALSAAATLAASTPGLDWEHGPMDGIVGY